MPKIPVMDANGLLAELTAADATDLSIRTALECIVKELGGLSGLAKEIKEDFDAAPKGSSPRIQLENTILRALQQFGAEEKPEQYTEDELIAMARAVMAEGRQAPESDDDDVDEEEEGV